MRTDPDPLRPCLGNPDAVEAVYSLCPIHPEAMPHALVKLVAMLLLTVQGAIGMAGGQVLCIPIRNCDTHHQADSRPCGHCEPAAVCADVAADDGCSSHDHEHGPFNAALHPNDDCGCHVHVPVPEEEQVPSGPRSESAEFRTLFVPLVIAVVLNWDCEPPCAVAARFHPPDFSASDQVRALKSTRLLI